MANNSQKLQYIVELLTQGDTTKAVAELKKLDVQSDKTGKSILGIGRSALAAFSVIAGNTLINESINQFLEAERSVAKLNAALRATGQFTPEVSAQMQALAESMAQVSQFADEEILNVIAKLTAMGVKAGDVKRVTQAILDLSTLMDRDLNRATMAFTQALNGNVEALKSVGIQIDETKTKTEQFNDAFVQVGQIAGGQAKAQIESLSGNFLMLKKNIDDVKKAFGGIILEALDPMIEKMSKLATLLASFGGSGRTAVGQAAKMVVNAPSVFNGYGYPGRILDNLLRGVQSTKTPTPVPFNPFGFNLEGGALTNIRTPGLDAADRTQTVEDIKKLREAIAKSAGETAKFDKESNAELERQAEDILARIIEGDKAIRDLREANAIVGLEGNARVREQLAQDHRARLQQINETQFATVMQYEEALALEAQLTEATSARFEEGLTFMGRMNDDIESMAATAQQAFASGLAGAIVDAFEEGDKAFQKFAANFLKMIAEMILQTIILNTLKSAFGGFGFGGQMSANGGQFAGTKMAMGGIAEVSRPTVFPNFNVMAGEAGREVLTVLSRPRRQNFGGLEAQVGMAGGNRLAITSADGLAGAMAHGGGMAVIRVELQPGLKAEIVENSIKGSELRVIQKLGENSEISRGVRKLAT